LTVSGSALANVDPTDTRYQAVAVLVDGTSALGVDHSIYISGKSGSYYRVDGNYLLAMVGGKPLIVLVESGRDARPLRIDGVTRFEGSFQTFSSKLQSRLAKAPALAGFSYPPFYLDTRYDYRSWGHFLLAVCVPLLLFGAWLVWLFIERSANPARHPFLKRLARYGPIEASVRQIDAEAQAGCRHFSGFDVTASWLIANSRTAANAMRLDSIVWAHLGLIERGGIIAAFDSFGQVWVETSIPRSQREKIMEAITARSPHCCTHAAISTEPRRSCKRRIADSPMTSMIA
jgi:hypothetical protein